MFSLYDLTLISLLKDLSIPKHEVHWKLIPRPAVAISYVGLNAVYNDLMTVILEWVVCWLFGLDWCGWKRSKRDTFMGS